MLVENTAIQTLLPRWVEESVDGVISARATDEDDLGSGIVGSNSSSKRSGLYLFDDEKMCSEQTPQRAKQTSKHARSLSWLFGQVTTGALTHMSLSSRLDALSR